jgi:hypothetical protein
MLRRIIGMQEYCESHMKHTNTPAAVNSFLVLLQSVGLCVFTAGLQAATTKLNSVETTNLIIFSFCW